MLSTKFTKVVWRNPTARGYTHSEEADALERGSYVDRSGDFVRRDAWAPELESLDLA